MLLTCKIWNNVEILHTITILLLIKNLYACNLIVRCCSLIKFTFVYILLLLQSIQKFLFLVVIEKLWFGAKSITIYDSITPVAWWCVNSIKLFGGLILLTGLCGATTALLSLLERCSDLNQFIVYVITIIKSVTVRAILYDVIWVMLDSVHFSFVIVISFDFVVIQLCALFIVLRWLLYDHLAAIIVVFFSEITFWFAEKGFVTGASDSIMQTGYAFFASRACVHFPHKCVCLGHDTPGLAEWAIRCDHLRIHVCRLIAPDDPLFHQWLIDFHIDGQALQSLPIVD